MQYVLGIDCGLTVCKAAVFDQYGHRLSESKASTPLQGLFIDYDLLWKNVVSCVGEAIRKSGLSGETIAAVGLSGHGNGLYALDEKLKPVVAVSSMYNANQQEVDEFTASNQYDAYFALARQSAWGGQPMQILKHLKKKTPEIYGRIRHVMLCKDYLRWRLTDTIASDYSDLSAAALIEGDTGRKLCKLLDIPEMIDAMPGAGRCDETLSAISLRASQETGLAVGTPVAGGGIDLFACMLGAGIAGEGKCSITAGTWGIALALSSDIRMPEHLTQTCTFLPELPNAAIVSSPTSCVNLDWFLSNVRPELGYEEANSIALSFAPNDVQMIYLPYLYPDMARPHIGCSFSNINVTDTWREMLYAICEGVCFAHRLQIDRLHRAGVHFSSARMSGGATNGEAWCRLMSNILNLPIEVPAEKQAGLLGGAMMAAVAAGIYPTLQSASSVMSRIERVFEPQPHAAYDEKYLKFRKLVGDRS